MKELLGNDDLIGLIGTQLTPEQLDKLSEAQCPKCSYRGFQLGPRGGAAQNIRCCGCGKYYNVITRGWRVVMGSELNEGGSTILSGELSR